eukprot:24473-Hanusia_phi.AAC.1
MRYLACSSALSCCSCRASLRDFSLSLAARTSSYKRSGFTSSASLAHLEIVSLLLQAFASQLEVFQLGGLRAARRQKSGGKRLSKQASRVGDGILVLQILLHPCLKFGKL